MQVPTSALAQIPTFSRFFSNSLAWPLFRWKAWSPPHLRMVLICSTQCVMRWNLVCLALTSLAEEGAFCWTVPQGAALRCTLEHPGCTWLSSYCSHDARCAACDRHRRSAAADDGGGADEGPAPWRPIQVSSALRPSSCSALSSMHAPAPHP